MKLLISGFEPFGDSSFNPSQNLVNAVSEGDFDDVKLYKLILPVNKDQAPNLLIKAIKEVSPDVVLSFGLAMGRAKISLERVALNLMDFQIADNTGVRVSDQPVVKGGPAAYFSTLPIRTLLEALQAAGIPTELSLSAGAYLCNQIFYRMMHHIRTNKLDIQAGFIHLPALPEQATSMEKSTPSMGLDLEIQALRVILSTLLKIRQ
jgi:pyroglutamyl-peptidase